MDYTPNHKKFSWLEKRAMLWLHNRRPEYRYFGILYINPETEAWLLEEPTDPEVIYGPVARHYMELLRRADDNANAKT